MSVNDWRKISQNSPRVACFGEVVIDEIVTDGESAYEIGGSPANVARGVNRLGGNSALITRLGDDRRTAEMDIEAVITDDGVELPGLSRPGTTLVASGKETRVGTVKYMPEYFPSREPEYVQFTTSSKAADSYIDINNFNETDPDGEEIKESIRQKNFLYFGSLSLTCDPTYTSLLESIEIARNSSVIVSFDLCVREVVWKTRRKDDFPTLTRKLDHIFPRTDIVKFTERELCSKLFTFTADKLRERRRHEEEVKRLPELHRLLRIIDHLTSFREKYPDVRLAVVTCGPHGCFWMRMTPKGVTPIYNFLRQQYPANGEGDSLGAGDAFVAAMYAKLDEHKVKEPKDLDELNRSQFDEIFDFANKAGSLCASKRGSQMPRLSEMWDVDPSQKK